MEQSPGHIVCCITEHGSIKFKSLKSYIVFSDHSRVKLDVYCKHVLLGFSLETNSTTWAGNWSGED